MNPLYTKRSETLGEGIKQFNNKFNPEVVLTGGLATRPYITRDQIRFSDDCDFLITDKECKKLMKKLPKTSYTYHTFGEHRFLSINLENNTHIYLIYVDELPPNREENIRMYSGDSIKIQTISKKSLTKAKTKFVTADDRFAEKTKDIYDLFVSLYDEMPKENLGKIGDYANVVSKNPKLLENCLKTKVYGDFPTKMIQERAKQLEPTKTPNSKEQLSFIIYCEKNIIKKIGKYFGLKTSLSKNVVTYLTDALHDGKSITPIVNSYLDKGIVPGRAKLFETLDNKTNKAN